MMYETGDWVTKADVEENDHFIPEELPKLLFSSIA